MVRVLWVVVMLAVLFNMTEAWAQEEHPVQARLVADSGMAPPGGVLRLGVELTMQAGWHTYGPYSGDAGRATEVVWDLPAGWTADPLQWPLPNKYEEEGDLVVYGYADQVVLLTEVQVAPEAALGDTVLIAADVSWLVCRELCIPGDAQLQLTLPVGAVQPQNRALFSRYAETLPSAIPSSVHLVHRVRSRGAERVLELSAVDSSASTVRLLDVYPLDLDAAQFRSYLRDGVLELVVTPYGEEAVGQLSGILVYAFVGDERRRSGPVTFDLSDGVVEQRAGLLEGALVDRGGDAAHAVWVYVLFGVIGGFILNLMPCVLPVISLKILSIVGQAGQDPRRVRQLGFAFAAGMVSTFLALALLVVLLKSGGEQIGWGFQFQYPGFVALMTALIFALGLSLFGVYEISLAPNQIGYSDGEGLPASFFNGVLATVLATPCTAPLLGTALGFAFAQSALMTCAIFSSIGVGMALPYVALALRPGWTRWLPRPGSWMERFKQGMGFLLMATVLWLLWVLGKQVGTEGVIWTGAFLLGIAVACWILGQWVRLEDGTHRRAVARAVALVVAVSSYAFFMHPVLVRSLPADEMESESSLEWIDFSPEDVERRVRAGQTVFVDFTAEWCWTCKVNERVVLEQASVRNQFALDEVATVKADWTTRNPQITQMLSAFGRSGVPLYVLFPGGHLDAPIVLPELISEEIVLESLAQAAALRSQR